jgi:NAD(P) transhydrogenase subunit alpha
VIIGVPSETSETETRVALTPPVAEQLIDQGYEVYVSAGAGEGSDWTDDQYRAVGCEVVTDRTALFEQANVVLRLSGLAGEDTTLDDYRDGQVVVGLLGPYDLADELATLADRNVSAFALELMPRISRAQSMDALSSMASIGGYEAVMVAAEASPRMFPMEMTAAGTVHPAEVFVVGAGVAGLKAVATADRLGASVRAYDIRLEVKREVESLGADFVELDLETEGSGDEEGYANEMDEEFYRQQRKELGRVVPESDVVITTAAIPRAPAPELVSAEMIADMDDGSVIVDLSAESGGNCEPTRAGETVHHESVRVFGPTNLPSRVSHTASQQLANNLRNFLDALLSDGGLAIDLDDEIIDSTLLTHEGTVRNPHRDEGGDEDGSDDANEADGAATGGGPEEAEPDAE